MNLQDVISLLAGAVGVPLINVLKNKMNLSGNAALALTLVVSVLLAVASIAATGSFTPDGLLAIGAQVFATSQLVYNLLNN